MNVTKKWGRTDGLHGHERHLLSSLARGTCLSLPSPYVRLVFRRYVAGLSLLAVLQQPNYDVIVAFAFPPDLAELLSSRLLNPYGRPFIFWHTHHITAPLCIVQNTYSFRVVIVASLKYLRKSMDEAKNMSGKRLFEEKSETHKNWKNMRFSHRFLNFITSPVFLPFGLKIHSFKEHVKLNPV